MDTLQFIGEARRVQARANQLKCITRMKLRVCVPKSFFYGRNAITREDLLHGVIPGAPHSDGETFFGLQLYFARRCCQNLQSARGLAQCKIRPWEKHC